MIRAWRASAFAISTSCCCPTESCDSRNVERQLETEFVEHAFARSRANRAHRRCKPPRVGSAPSAMFCRRGELRHERELLIDHADAEPLGGLRRVDLRPRSPSMRISPVVGAQRAGQNLHQRRFARRRFRRRARALRPRAASAKRRTARERRESSSRCRASRAACGTNAL